MTDDSMIFADVSFQLNERKDKKWDLYIRNSLGKQITILGPLTWDDVVRECNRCQRIRFDFIENLKKGK